MKSDPQVITLLNDVLTAELTAVNQYWLHARLCHHWGFERLYEKIRQESIEEMKHADVLVERILYLAVEYEAVKRFNAGIEAVRAAGDNGTREILETMLREEEEHVDWLETQLQLIDQLGEKAYLAEQLRAG